MAGELDILDSLVMMRKGKLTSGNLAYRGERACCVEVPFNCHLDCLEIFSKRQSLDEFQAGILRPIFTVKRFDWRVRKLFLDNGEKTGLDVRREGRVDN